VSRQLAGVALALSLAAAARAELVAEQITPATAAQREVGGPDAIGGVGDWYLANDVVEVVIDDVSRAYGVSTHGGTLVDFGLRGRTEDDQFARLSPIVNLSQRVVVAYDAIRAEVDPHGAFARITVTSPGLRALPRGSRVARALDPLVPDPAAVSSVRVETIYEVRPGEPFVRIDTALTNTGPTSAPVFAFGDVWMRGGRGGRGFTADLAHPDRSRGFLARDMSANILASLGVLASYSYAALIGTADFPPIAYALDAPERAARGLPIYGMAGEHATLAFGLVGDPPVADFGLGALARALLFGDLAPDATWHWQRRLHAAGTRDLAALDGAIRRDLGKGVDSGVAGSVAVAGRRAVVAIERPSGAVVTAIGVDPASGAFRAALPPGDYRAVLRVEQAAPQRRAVRVEAGRTTVLAFDPPPEPAHLVFAPAFADGGPGRIEIRGRDGTPDPVFGDDLFAAARDDGSPLPNGTASSAVVFVGNDRDPRGVAIAPGRYELVATRGLDFEAASQRVDLSGPGQRAVAAPFALRPLALLEGYVTADLHVHSQSSDDGQATHEDRLRRFLAEGVSVLVATDHDNVADYGPAVARLGVAGRVRVVQGVEVTGSGPSAAALWTIGHHNAWPIPYQPHGDRHGAPPSQNRAVGALYAELRGTYGARVVQLNHPRPTPKNVAEGDLNLAFFEHLGEGRAFEPALPLDAPENEPLVRRTGADGTRAIDFDAIELMNGDSWPQYLAVRADWHALLRQGFRRTATANSDSHAAVELLAYPRNYVFVGPEGDDARRFDAALLAGRSFGTNGPRVRQLRVNGGSIGGVVAAAGGRVRVEYAVDAAGWVPLDEVRILVNGEVAHASPDRSGVLDLSLERDGFVTLEAGAPLDADPPAWIRAHPGLYTEVLAPGFVSAAFTNPVFVDVDGNGRFDPPGP
jgi:hypothetical protein